MPHLHENRRKFPRSFFHSAIPLCQILCWCWVLPDNKRALVLQLAGAICIYWTIYSNWIRMILSISSLLSLITEFHSIGLRFTLLGVLMQIAQPTIRATRVLLYLYQPKRRALPWGSCCALIMILYQVLILDIDTIKTSARSPFNDSQWFTWNFLLSRHVLSHPEIRKQEIQTHQETRIIEMPINKKRPFLISIRYSLHRVRETSNYFFPVEGDSRQVCCSCIIRCV